MTPSQYDIAWFAGLFDGEGCLFFAERTDNHAVRISRKSGKPRKYGPYLQVRCSIKIAMAHKETIVCVGQLISEIVGKSVRVFEERRNIKRRRPLWRTELNDRVGMLTLLTALHPFLRTKKLEADLAIDYLARVNREPSRWRHVTERDVTLARLATRLRHGCGEAPAEAEKLLSEVIPSLATEGKGSVESVTTRSVSPNNNPIHERPAPHAGEEIV